MERIEMVEALRAKAEVSYEEARQALEENGWDLLAALVSLEKDGKIRGSKAKEEKKMDGARAQVNTRTAEGWINRFVGWVKGLIEAGNRNHFIVRKDGRQVMEVSVTIAALLFILLHGFFMFVFVISLFFGYRYSFRSEKDNLAQKREMEEARAAAEQLNNHHTVNSFGETA